MGSAHAVADQLTLRNTCAKVISQHLRTPSD